MTSREQLIQELAEVPDELIKVMLDFLHRVQTTRSREHLNECKKPCKTSPQPSA
ncbi:hypothetical protein [Nostoc sp.]|uniref:hypothetical protein n=1 Tax=Nostoc sp. TaxID=1180 RepID=UPI002FF9EA43